MYYQILDTSCLAHLYNYLKTQKHTTYPINKYNIGKIKEYTNLDFYIIIHKNMHYYYCKNIDNFIKNLNNNYLDQVYEKYRCKFLEICCIVDSIREDEDDDYIINIMKGYQNIKSIIQNPFYFTNEFTLIQIELDIDVFIK
jgi:hypothetical protein